jgi:hypothetical protein
MKLEKKPHHLVGQYGVYYVSARLSILGFNAVPTMRNTKTIDIVVENPDNGKATGVQVKTQRRTREDVEKDYFRVRPGIPAKIDQEREFQVPFVLVYYDENDKKTRCFVVPKEEMLTLCKSFWNRYQDKTAHRTSNYGQMRSHLSIGIRQLHKYEDHWENLGIDLPSMDGQESN